MQLCSIEKGMAFFRLRGLTFGWMALTVLLVFVSAGSARCELVYPGKTWDVMQPSQAGMDAGALRKFTELLGGNGCVVRHGCLVAAWGEYRERSDVASAAKPLYSYFLFKAIEDGRIRSIDDQVVGVVKGLRTINKQLACKDSAITWRHLGTQTACYGVRERPGAAFVYNDWQMAFFFDALFGKIYGASHAAVDEQVLHPMLTDPLGCEDNPTLMAFGARDRAGRLAISPRDFARFGLLYLRHGGWNDRQLLSPGFISMAMTDPLPNSLPRTTGTAAEMLPGQRTIGSQIVPDNQTDHSGSYSWLWWVNGVDRCEKRNWPNAPIDTCAALGHGGEEGLVIIPSLGLVVSWNHSKLSGGAVNHDAAKLLAGAVLDADSMADRIAVDQAHPSWLMRRNGAPFFMCGPGDPEGFLYRGKLNSDGTRDGDQMQLIHKLAGTGANCIYMIAVRSHGGDGDPTQNPFIDHEASKGLNMRLLDQWEQWFAEMDRNNITIFLIVYDDAARIWDTGDTVSPAEERFFRGLVSRFKHHRNLIWCIAEEYEEAMTAARVSQLAAIVRQSDEYQHPIAVHKLAGTDFSEFADDPNIDQYTMQYNVRTAQELHDGIIRVWNQSHGRFNINLAEADRFGKGAEARKKLWACAMAGAYVMVYQMDIVGTALSDLRDCGRVVKFMQFVDYRTMAPHDELAAGGTKYVLASTDGSYVLYSDEMKANPGLKSIRPGKYELSWFDCVTGRWVIQPHTPVKDGSTSWTRPAVLGDEVALYIRREAAK